MKEKKTKNNIIINSRNNISTSGILIVLLIFSVIGEPDLLDQFIAITKNYAESIKCSKQFNNLKKENMKKLTLKQLLQARKEKIEARRALSREIYKLEKLIDKKL